MTVVAAIILLAVGITLGVHYECNKTIKITDNFIPNKHRTEAQIANDAVLQLSNEIVRSGALKFDDTGDGEYRISLKLKK